MKHLTLLVLLILFKTEPAFSSQEIIFNITLNGLPPYLIKEADSSASGIMLDVLQPIAHKHGYSIKIASVPKKRELNQVDLERVDATPMAKEWVPNPPDYAFTDPVVKARDVLFSLKEKHIELGNIQVLFGNKLGTHIGYHYPTLETYFNSGLIKRSNAATERDMLGMLMYERTQAAVLNELVGGWFIKNNPLWKNRFHVSTQAVSEVGLRILFHKKWQHFVILFNQELAIMKQDGQLQAIISRYQ